MSRPTDGAAAQAIEAIVKTMIPAWNIRRRPSRSAKRPAATSSAAKMML